MSVRKGEHYDLGHIPGAINIPWKNIADPENLAKLPTDQPIVVYCYTGHTGQIASTALNLLGYDATNLKFGMMGWTEDDEVLATARYGPDTAMRDYTVETEPKRGDGDVRVSRAEHGRERMTLRSCEWRSMTG